MASISTARASSLCDSLRRTNLFFDFRSSSLFHGCIGRLLRLSETINALRRDLGSNSSSLAQ
jgi:hypothetical protein